MEKIFKNRYLISLLTITLFNLSLSGCYSAKEVAINDDENLKISKIVLNDGTQVEFTGDSLGYAYLSYKDIVRINNDGKKEIFPIDNIKTIYTEKFDVINTAWFVIGCAAVLYLLIAGLFFSSMNGGFGG